MIAFTGSPLDRADHIRADPDALAALMDWRARLLVLDGLLPAIDDAGALQLGQPGRCSARCRTRVPRPDPEPSGPRPASPPCPTGAMPARVWPTRRCGRRWRCSRPPISRSMAGRAASSTGTRGTASALGAAARPTLAKGGWQRDCGACGAQHFPRTDPVTIMLVEHTDGRLHAGPRAGLPEGRFPRWQASSSRAKPSRRPLRAKSSRRAACACAT